MVESVSQTPYRDAAVLDRITHGSPNKELRGIIQRRQQGYSYTDTITNYLLHTDNLANAAWIKTTAHTVTAVTGDVEEFMVKNYSKVTPSSGSQTVHQVSSVLPAGNTAFFSCWMKAPIDMTVIITLEEVGVGNQQVTCALTTQWQYFEVSRSWPNNVAAKITFAPQTVDDYWVGSPMLTKGTVRFPMYIKSEATNGVYIKVQTVPRFKMTQNTNSRNATKMVQTPVPTTAKMMQDI